jgi:hypothetical protein
MDIKRLVKFIIAIIILCSILISLFWCLLSDNMGLRDGLIAETVGGGILGAIVAAIFFYLQEADEYQTNKKKALSFYNDKLILDLKEAFDRNPSPWNFSGLNKFYFDNSRINSLYDVYQSNFGEINDYDAYYPDSKLIDVYKDFYREVRKGYVLGEKLEGEIYQLVRKENHKRSLIAAKDFGYRAYLKGNLFANISDVDISRYMEWNTLPDTVPQLLEVAKNNTTITSLIAEIKKVRESLLTKEKKIKKLVEKN